MRTLRVALLLIILLFGRPFLTVRQVQAAASLELYGMYHTIGVIVTLDSGDDPN